ncbi:MAG: hypothetical protein RRC34_06975 [Lentisphaeria bacterium]|nr:hypothetical protein [Lentisphaeria bacterium]
MVTTPRFLNLAGVFLLACGGFQVSANELITTLRNENAELRKKAQDLNVAMAAARQSEALKAARVEELETEKTRLENQLATALKRADAAEKRVMEAEEQTSQAVATMKELRSFVERQADAVTAQKEEISATERENQALMMKRTEADAAREEALKTAAAARADAEQAHQKALREEADSHYNLGVVLAKHRKFEAAEKQFLACLNVLPDDADAHYNLGILYEGALKSRSKAARHYKRFLELRPMGPDTEKVSQWLEEMR